MDTTQVDLSDIFKNMLESAAATGIGAIAQTETGQAIIGTAIDQQVQAAQVKSFPWLVIVVVVLIAVLIFRKNS